MLISSLSLPVSLCLVFLHPPGGSAFLCVCWYTKHNQDKRLAHPNWPGWFLLGLESLKTWKGIEYQQCGTLSNKRIFVFIGELPSTSSPDLPGYGVNWNGRKPSTFPRTGTGYLYFNLPVCFPYLFVWVVLPSTHLRCVSGSMPL